jgi:5-oxoprolinase (ATP-hydrolysing)
MDTAGLYHLLVEEPAKHAGCSGCRNYRDVESDIKAVSDG